MGTFDLMEPDAIRKMSINVSAALGTRVRKLAFDADISESSIVETALRKFIDAKSDEELKRKLKREGASLRRPNRK